MTILRASQAAGGVGDPRPLTLSTPRLRSLVATATVASLVVTAVSPAFSAKPVAAAKKTPSFAHVRVETAHLRSGPAESHRTVGLLDAGRTARVVSRSGSWLRVRLGTGTEGWVRGDLLRVSHATPAPKPGAKPVKTADTAAKKSAQALAAVHAQKLAVARAKKIQAARAAAARKAVLASQHAAALKEKELAAARKRAEIAAEKARKRSVYLARIQAVAQAKAVARAKRLAAQTARATEVRRVAQAIREETAPPEQNEAPQQAADAEAPVDGVAAAPDPHSPAPPENGVQVASADNTPAVIAPAGRRIPRGESVVRTALSYRGTPYRFGARGRGAFDCSGFTSYLFAENGVGLPRTAAQQFRKGMPVPKSGLQPGDLVFFKNTYRRGVSHVGIYIGDNKFVHAASSGRGVRVDSLAGGFYSRHWAGARRAR